MVVHEARTWVGKEQPCPSIRSSRRTKLDQGDLPSLLARGRNPHHPAGRLKPGSRKQRWEYSRRRGSSAPPAFQTSFRSHQSAPGRHSCCDEEPDPGAATWGARIPTRTHMRPFEPASGTGGPCGGGWQRSQRCVCVGAEHAGRCVGGRVETSRVRGGGLVPPALR